ncbi:MAG: hypothetical protein GY941_11995 [Planctomycetes bacterium]|nr:hypothetical protein [Planctomycetota bacterium]
MNIYTIIRNEYLAGNFSIEELLEEYGFDEGILGSIINGDIEYDPEIDSDKADIEVCETCGAEIEGNNTIPALCFGDCALMEERDLSVDREEGDPKELNFE